jgi:hypothetical protein
MVGRSPPAGPAGLGGSKTGIGRPRSARPRGRASVCHPGFSCDEFGRYGHPIGADGHIGQGDHEIGRQDQLRGDQVTPRLVNTRHGKNEPPVRPDGVYPGQFLTKNVGRFGRVVRSWFCSWYWGRASIVDGAAPSAATCGIRDE